MILAHVAAGKSINIAVERMRKCKNETKPKPSALSF